MKYAHLDNKVVDGTYRYVEFLCRIRGIDDTDVIDDLRGVASDALLTACETYDPSRGAKFTTWSRVLVKAAVRRQLGVSRAPVMPVPKHTMTRWWEFSAARDRFVRREMRQPTNIEWAAECGVPVKDLLKIRDRAHQQRWELGPDYDDEYNIADDSDYAELSDIFRDAELATALLVRAKEELGEKKVRSFVYVTFNEDDLTVVDIAKLLGVEPWTVRKGAAEVAKYLRERI